MKVVLCAPANVVHTAKRVAELRNISLEDLCLLTTDNARRRFGLNRSAELAPHARIS